MPRVYTLMLGLLLSSTALANNNNPNNVPMLWYDFSNLMTGTVTLNLPLSEGRALQIMPGSSYMGIGYKKYFDVVGGPEFFNPFYRFGSYVNFRSGNSLYPYVYIGTHSESARSGLSYGIDIGVATLTDKSTTFFSNMFLTINF